MPMVAMIHFSCYFCSESNARAEYVLSFAYTLMGIPVPPSHGVSRHPVCTLCNYPKC